MTTATRNRANNVLVLVLALAILPLSGFADDYYSPYVDQPNPTNVYWGDTHLHTNLSVDANGMGNNALTPNDAGLEELSDGMKAILRYAEDTVNYEDAQLSLLGWGGKAAPTSLEAPGQARTLEIVSQGEGWVTLDWKKPADGGAVAFYKIDRRERPAGNWALIALAMESEGTLNNQERGKDWEYRVIAVNKAGEGVPSNTVAAVV